jgi:hypothetical protein
VNNSVLSIQAGTAAPVVSGAITGTGTLKIDPGFLQLAVGSGVSTQGALSLTQTSTLDITNNALAINYGVGNPSPLAEIQAEIFSGAFGGDGVNGQILSSTAQANDQFAVGYADGSLDTGTTAAPGEVLIQYALVGDANLDGGVNITDLLTLLNNYGDTGEDWSQGDFNYDGSVNITDLLAMLNNYGQSAPTITSTFTQGTIAIPEPATLSLFMLGGAALLPRSRRR